MIIEFLGIPGSGKTYISSKLVSELSNQNVTCINLVGKSRNDIKYKIFFRSLRVYISISPKHQNIKKNLLLMLNEYRGVKARFNTVCIDVYVNTIVLYKLLGEIYITRKGLYILDEGIAQQIANMVVNFNICWDIVEKILIEIATIRPIIRIETSVEQSVMAIQERNRHICYIDELTGEELNEFLFEYENACENICQMVETYTINIKNQVDDNIFLIRKLINI